jgi:sporulation protein YlmC with PRC-barrel domain
MIRAVKHLRGLAIEATDGPIGSVHDVYFDDEKWTVRYYVIDTGKWLPGRKVLIPPHVIRETTPGHPAVAVNLTREQIRNSPDMDTERPVSRPAEFVLYRYYGWTPYWFPLEPATPVAVHGDAAEREREAIASQRGEDANLRSAKEVIGYHVEASDGEIGHIEDFLIDDQSSRIRYAVVDTKNWLPGKTVLIAPEWIREMKWSESKVYVNPSRDAVRNSPEYNAATTVEGEYESQLHSHYGYPLPLL